MAGIFVSYSRADREFADRVIRGLAAIGVGAWWDEDMRGVDWQEELERQIGDLAAVLVLWTPNSIGSKNVRDEARLALKAEKLVNVLLGVTEPPFPFDRVNGLPLDTWTGREPHGGWARLVQTLDGQVARARGAKPGEIIRAQTRRDQELRVKHFALGGALEAMQAAQAQESQAAAAVQAAETAVDTATDQLRRVAEMRANALILKAAQNEIESAQAAKAEADLALQRARIAVADASRVLAKATSELEAPFVAPIEPMVEPGGRKRRAAVRAAAPAADPPRDATLASAEATSRTAAYLATEPASRAAAFLATTTPPEPVPAEPAPPAPSPPAHSPLQLDRSPARRRADPRLVIAGGAAGLVIVAVAVVLALRLGGGASSAQPQSPVAAPSPAQQLAASLDGAWSSPGLGCGDQVRAMLSTHDGAIYLTVAGTTSVFKIGALESAGVIDTSADGAAYKFNAAKPGALTITGLSTPLKMTRCGG